MLTWLETDFSTVLLYGNLILFPAFIAFYGTREPWRHNWFGWAIMLLLIGIAQLTVRAYITSRLGENYAGRDLVLMFGRLELFLSGLALFVALIRMRRQHPRPRA